MEASIGMKQLSDGTKHNPSKGTGQGPSEGHKFKVQKNPGIKSPFKPISGPKSIMKRSPGTNPEVNEEEPEFDLKTYEGRKQKREWEREQKKATSCNSLICLSEIIKEAAIRVKDLESSNPGKSEKPVVWGTIPSLIKRLLRNWGINSPSKIKQTTHEVVDKDSNYSFRINKNIKDVNLSKTTRPQLGLIDKDKGLNWTQQGDVINLTLPLEKDEFAKEKI